MDTRYGYIKKTINSFEHLAAFPWSIGVDNLEGLYRWESADVGNRRVYITSNHREASVLLQNLK